MYRAEYKYYWEYLKDREEEVVLSLWVDACNNIGSWQILCENLIKELNATSFFNWESIVKTNDFCCEFYKNHKKRIIIKGDTTKHPKITITGITSTQDKYQHEVIAVILRQAIFFGCNDKNTSITLSRCNNQKQAEIMYLGLYLSKLKLKFIGAAQSCYGDIVVNKYLNINTKKAEESLKLLLPTEIIATLGLDFLSDKVVTNQKAADKKQIAEQELQNNVDCEARQKQDPDSDWIKL